MLSSAITDLDWSSIHPLNGSKQDAFEELCTQLARAARPASSQFIRKGRPDSGVEAHAILADQSEWAWQSKYFDSMKTSQWSQLDESVKTALVGHPRLTRFIVCVPLDLPDGRTGNSKSARQHWDEHVVKWSSWAAHAGMSVEFVWQGSHELLTELAKPDNYRLVPFFFGGHHIDADWFQRRLSEAHSAAGPRYTPELNVQLDLSQDFAALGRTPEFLAGVRSKALAIRSRLANQPFALAKDPGPTLQGKTAAAQAACARALEAFRTLSDDPSEPSPLDALRSALREAAACCEVVLDLYQEQRAAAKSARELDANEAKANVTDNVVDRASIQVNDDHDLSYSLRELRGDLRAALSHVQRFRNLASSNLVVLTGNAGTGKTHLLCDLARQRLDKGRPTVVLMGQRFLDIGDPWVQGLQQLDLAAWSARDFIGALEVAAQRANSRALLIIDAINEGAGRQLWPTHLAPFLDRVKASPWISTILSVRTSYAEDLLPDSVGQSAVFVEHAGFRSVEFSATRAFFDHFGIDFPSTPLLAPEFSNPLYLKTLCQGLQASGKRRLPRGFHGVVKAFNQYVAGINHKVAKDLDYDVRNNLVVLALKDLAARMVAEQHPWLTYEDAERIANARLPGRDYSRSLMSRLFGEGLLIEEKAWSTDEDRSVSVVQFAYERLSDYFCVQSLLDQHLDLADPPRAFKEGGPLDVDTLCTAWSRPGFHEALHILVAERTGQELIVLLPTLAKRHFTARVFLSSIVWRDPEAVTPQAIEYLLSLKRSHTVDVIDTLVTLATVPDHPLNIHFSDELLRQSGMAERDAWWTIGLNDLWERQVAVDRLIQWADQLWPRTELADEAAGLAASTLAWLLPASNRFLRDRATKALVRVLTWRPSVIEQLIEDYVDVDDVYVAERVLAAAYGAAMRTSDVAGVVAVANRTHAKVFAAGRPRVHLLFREYARGIIKRAEYMQKRRGAAWSQVDPPYASDWPTIPTEGDIDVIAPEWSSEASDSVTWGHHRIRSSVMSDDFGRYVIGTNSWTTNFLSLRLDEPQWMSLDQRIERAVSTLNEAERTGWELFRRAEKAVNHEVFLRRIKEGVIGAPASTAAGAPTKAEQLLNAVRSQLLTDLGPKAALFAPLMDEIIGGVAMRTLPKFDLTLVQRYIVGRVFELGWTSERFEQHDRQLGSAGRAANKCERIGKKYQWIAYHEMLAFMADHYQYAVGHSSKEMGTAYQGSWQDDFRDIDPSEVSHPKDSDADTAPSPQNFWVHRGVSDWQRSASAAQWANITDDIPQPADLLFSHDRASDSEWVSLYLDLKWAMPSEASLSDGRREIWMHADGALVKVKDIDKLMGDAIARRIARHPVSDGGLHEIYLGEIGWSEASTFFHDPYYAHLGWAGEVNLDKIAVTAASQGYMRERGGVDCSVTSESVSLRVPTEQMLRYLGAEWSGISATYVDSAGVVMAFDPSPNVGGRSTFLVRKDKLLEVLRTYGLAVCWVIQGEKIDAAGSPKYTVHSRRTFQGLFVWTGSAMEGDYSFEQVEAAEVED